MMGDSPQTKNEFDCDLQYKDEAFKFQLEMLKAEVEVINQAFGRLDQMTQAIRNWAILVWGGSIAIVLGQLELRKFVIFTAILPVLFWYSDGLWRYYVRQLIFRQRKISEFLSSERLFDAFRIRQISDFKILDPMGRQYRHTEEYKKIVNVWQGLKLNDVSFFYFGLMLVSVGIGLFFLMTK